MTRNNPAASGPTNYQKVVIPTDGSDGAQHAAEHGLMVADAFDATVHAVSVVEGAGSVKRDQLRNSPEEMAQQATDSVAQRAEQRGIPIETVTLSGTPEQALSSYIEENDVDLVVMSTHGRTGIEHFVFGSIAEDVVRNSPVPVLTVRPPQWED